MVKTDLKIDLTYIKTLYQYWYKILHNIIIGFTSGKWLGNI